MSNNDDEKFQVFFGNQSVGEIDKSDDRLSDYRAGIELIKKQGLGRDVPKVDVIYHQARSFAAVSQRLHDANSGTMPWRPLDIAPFVVNSCFAVEVYLKAIGELFCGKFQKGHDLAKLFSNMPIKVKALISDTFDVCQEEKKITKKITALACLRAHRKAFVEWRYMYEKSYAPEIQIARIVALLIACDRVFRAEYEIQKKDTK